MKKNKPNIGAAKSNTKIFLVVIIILALAAAVGVYELFSASKTTIYCFNDDYPAGTAITSDILVPAETEMFLVNKFDAASGNKGYVTEATFQDVSGQFLATDVLAGSPLIKAVTSGMGGSPAEVKLEDGNVAMTAPVDNIAVGGPKVQPGAFVNVYVGITENQQSKEELLLEKVKVLDIVYAQLQNDNTNAPVIEGASLEVSPADSIKLAKAIQFGTIRFGLVKATYEKTGGASEIMQNITLPQLPGDANNEEAQQ